MTTINKRLTPNFLITGTPGVGKTTLSNLAAEQYQLLHIPVSRLIADRHLWKELDTEHDCTIYDDDMVADAIDEIYYENPDGGVIFDFHCSDIVEIPYVDYVIVLRTESDTLFARLKDRDYSDEKTRENVEAEIFRVVIDEVIDDFPQEKIIELKSDTEADMQANLARIGELIANFKETH